MKKFSNLLWFISILVTSIGTVLFAYSYSSAYCVSENNIDVSVIIPVYNVEKYIGECLDSVENQTKKDGVEIICVNDGSKDKSPEILKKHAKKNKRIKIINQKNKGVSAARNTGMKAAKGKYIMFVDSDDLLIPHAVEKAYQTAEKYDVDVVRFSNKCFRDGRKIDLNSFTYDESKVRVVQRKPNESPFKMLKTIMIWNKIYKREFLEKNNLTFKEGLTYAEDLVFNQISLPHVYKVAIDRNKLYAYRACRPGSAVNSKRSIIKNINNGLLIAEEFANRCDQIKFDGSDNWISNRIINSCYGIICNKLKDKNQKSTYAKKHLAIIDEYIKKNNIELSDDNKSKVKTLRSFVL